MKNDRDEESIDHRQIERIREIGGDALLSRVIDAMLESAPRCWKELCDACQDSRWQDAARSVHTLRSSVEHFGSRRLIDWLAELEQIFRKEKGPAQCPSLPAQEFESLMTALIRMKKTLP